MLSARVIRKKKMDYPAAFRRINARFLEAAGTFVEGEAKTRAPVRTGRLRGSLDHRTTDDTAIVGTNVEYAQHVEYGTQHMSAQPFLRPALDENRKRLVKMYHDTIRKVFGGR